MSLKNDILELLERDRGTAYSGTLLAERFGVSRNAVWKAVNALKADGHDILTDGRRGYLLSNESDRLSVDGIIAYLPDDMKDVGLVVLDKTGSTNDEAKRYILQSGNTRAAVVAEQQTAGRTRAGNRFYSPFGTGLYISVIMAMDGEINGREKAASDIASAVQRAVKTAAGVDTDIVPPCDLYLSGKKVCGILIEADVDLISGRYFRLIAGIGINVTTEDFPDELRDKAVSLGTAAVRCRLAAGIIKELYSLNDRKGAQK